MTADLRREAALKSLDRTGADRLGMRDGEWVTVLAEHDSRISGDPDVTYSA